MDIHRYIEHQNLRYYQVILIGPFQVVYTVLLSLPPKFFGAGALARVL